MRSLERTSLTLFSLLNRENTGKTSFFGSSVELDGLREPQFSAVPVAKFPARRTSLKEAEHIANQLRQPDPASKLRPMLALVERVDLFDGGLSINVSPAKLADSLGVPEGEQRDQAVRLDCAAVRIRKGKQVRLVLPGAASAPTRQPDPKLVALLAEAMATKAFLLGRPGYSIRAMASEQQRCRTRFTRVLHISCLAPEIVAAIVRGQQPESLTAEALQNAVIPLAWSEQRAALGFA